MDKKLKILITTGIYPPDLGGPAKYAVMLSSGINNLGHSVTAFAFSRYLKYPTGIRHIIYFLKVFFKVYKSDFVIALDTFSVCLPSFVACKILRKKIIVRTGGDFLWESYLDRTQKTIKLSDFYKEDRFFNLKERLVFWITKVLLNNVDVVVFSTKYQKDIFTSAYDISEDRCAIIENLYLKNDKRNIVPKKKVFIAPFRNTFFKNKNRIVKAFEIINKRFVDVFIDFKTYSGDEFERHLRDCYAVLIPSLSEISPNLAIEATCSGIPVILTEDCGIKERLDGYVVWVNPESVEDIVLKIEKMIDNTEYSSLVSKLTRFDFEHNKEDIAREFLNIYQRIK